MNIELMLDEWVQENTKILDLGCGDGTILSNLKVSKNIKGFGIEIDRKNIQKCLEKGINIIEHNIDAGLKNISANSFDIVIMSQTIQTLKNPSLALEEITRVGKRCVVTIPNFGHWKARLALLVRGKMPVTKSLSESWYQTQNIHLCTIKDFENLCSELSISIEERKFLNSNGNTGFHSIWANLFSSYAIYKIYK